MIYSLKKMFAFGFATTAIVFFSLLSLSSAGTEGMYNAPLPPELYTDPDLCAYVPCKDVMPQADNFSKRKGNPPYIEAYKGDKKELLGYVFLSTDIVDIPAYSGKPVVTLFGMDTKGVIKNIKILRHSEPILMVGIPEKELIKFVDQYAGKFVGDKIEVGKEEGAVGIDAISGATVTSIAENRTIVRSGYLIAKQAGMIKAKARTPIQVNKTAGIKDWDTLVKEGSIQHLVVEPRDVKAEVTGQPWMDIYFGTLDQPTIAQSILGENGYNYMLRGWREGDHAVFIVGKGTYSFKGSGFVRGAIFDRIKIAQGDETYTFTDKDYDNLPDLAIKGGPEIKEGGIFIIRNSSFDPAYPWSLVVLTATRDVGAKKKEFFSFSREYLLPEKYIIGKREIVREEAPWEKVWKSSIPGISFLFAFLLAVAILFVKRTALVKRKTVALWVRYGVMAVSLVFIGFYKMAQPSVTQALTLTHNFLHPHNFSWSLFLLDPMIFLLWWFIGITVFIWGRGLFCGWICPYGALTEFAYRIFHRIFPKRFTYEFPRKIHKRLIYVKYGILGFLIAVSFYSMGMAERFAEVEPFKSAFLVGPFKREWPFVAYFVALFVLCLVTYRFFCKYLCPLGAGLAALTTFRLFGIKRKEYCAKCSICDRSCLSLAIGKAGRIDRRECLYCLECEKNFHDREKCPPLIREMRDKKKTLATINVKWD